ncbi:MAG: electron transport complex subunit E [Candidatus Marinimicrobia bacterium]|jgi:electron transport complex protein RnfE|nr:electron transport complex subunit E [Candidatus Neomarinimicrobiota bacterium]MDD4961468.1 electron transport complex subunit E [Candidatus Neomarinimicrobiota bacterium]MDD5709641.1 electron transport complex subunit E [Candidatus Neomarinimicrobiota bacterium]MDX9777388.1 electron transport complex subunit E [bacterium]
MKQKTAIQEFLKGLWDENPVLVSLLGLCPTLAVTVSAINGLAMGLAATFVLLCSAFLVSLLRKVIPNQVRIASYIVIIATFVTIADRFLAAYTPDISKALGPFIPLIIVNCIILGRMEAFASKNGIGRSLLDALGMGAGFTLTLLVLSSIREILGSGTWFGMQLMWPSFAAWKVMVLPPGAFLTLGCMIAAANWINTRRRS